MRAGAIIAFIFAAMGFLATTQNYLINPALVRANFVSMVVFPRGLAALGVYLWKKADRATAIDAEIVDEPPEHPLN
jgi:hypothetical protein